MAEKKKPATKKKAAVKKKPAKQTKAAADANKTMAKPKETNDFPIVGMGASAGGLEALEAFFSHMPPDSGIAICHHPASKPQAQKHHGQSFGKKTPK